MFPIWASVKVTNEQHPRFGQAGCVQAINPNAPDERGVRFDLDGALEVVAIADLQAM